MMNYILYSIESGVGRSLYADNGVLWKRGRNIPLVESKVQNAVNEVERWAKI